MDRWLLCFILGAILSLLAPSVPVLFYDALIFLVLICCFVVSQLRIVGAILLGVLWMLNHASSYQTIWQDNQLTESKQFFSQKQHANMVIKALPEQTEQGWHFIAQITALNHQTLARPLKVKLSWQQSNLILSSNDRLAATIKLKPAHGLANLGGFNYQRWLRSQDIVATGYVVTNRPYQHVPKQVNLRARLYDKVKHLTHAQQFRPLLLALTFGDRSLFNAETWQVLQATGTQHLVAISGLHIGLVVTLSFFAVFFILRLLPSLLLSRYFPQALNLINWVYLTLAVTIAASGVYAYLAGFSIPTVRALIFFYVFCLSQCFAVKFTPTRLVLVAMVITIMLIPSSLYSVSFWLSYLAVILILLITWRSQKTINQFAGVKKSVVVFLLVQCLISLMLLPITALTFGQVSLVAFIANCLALPLVSIVVMPLLLLGLLLLMVSETLAWLFFYLADFVLAWLWLLLSALSTWPMASYSLAQSSIWLVVFIVLVIAFIWLINLKAFTRATVLMSVSCLLFVTLSGVMKSGQQWQVNVLDVGQGLAVAINKNNKTLLYDTGNAFPSGWNMAEQVVMPFLRYHDSKLDTVIISHNDNDHAGGLNALIKHMPALTLIYNQPTEVPSTVTQLPCLAGNRFKWQELTIEMLWPSALVFDSNDESCVVRISDKHHSVLLTGDITKRVEKQLVEQNVKLNADVVIAPHHGSKSSSSDAFIAQIEPSAAIFSAGFMNQWQMPNQQVLARYQRQGVNVYSTNELGMITVTLTANDWQVTSFRQDMSPYWFNN